MDRSDIVAVLLVIRNKGVRVLNTIHKVASSLNHALIDELLEGFFLAGNAQVEKELVPETAVNQVTCSMLATTHIQVHILPVLIRILAHKCLVVVWIHIAEIISRTTCKTRHRVEFDREYGLVVNLRVLHNLLVHLVPSPNGSVAEWWLTCFRRQELVHLRQFDRQTLLWNHRGDAILVIHREWFTPITLTGEDGIAQTVVHLHTTNARLLHILLGGSNRLFYGQSIEGEVDVWLHVCTW